MACSTVILMESGHRERKAIIITVSRSLRERAVRFYIKIDSKDTEDSFNVVVVQESTKVLYNEKNEPYADWTQIADTSETAGE